MPVVTLPDGSQRTFDAPVTVFDVAADIGAGLAKAALLVWSTAGRSIPPVMRTTRHSVFHRSRRGGD